MSSSFVKRFFQSKLFLIFIVLIIVFFSLAALRDYYKQEDLRDDVNKLQNQIYGFENAQTDLMETLARVKEDDFVEIEARTKLNLRKPGEQVIIVSNQEDINKVNDQAEQSSLKSLLKDTEKNSIKWWHYFFN